MSAVAVFSLAVPQRSFACASCGCTLGVDAAMGYPALPGWRASLEYDYIDQDQLRSGTRAVSGVPDGYELEHRTINQYATAGISYNFPTDWNVTVLVPYVIRSHSTYGNQDSIAPLRPLSRSFSSSVGDIKLLGSYQGLLPTRHLAIQLGIKLPSGRYGTAVDFHSGPAAGSPLDASLQPGTGSTDVIVGAYYHRMVGQDFDAFASGQFQSAVRHHMDQPGSDYRPGNSVTVSLGARYIAGDRWTPQLQVNLLHKAPDQGALADVQNSAGTVAYVSPGLSAGIGRRANVFAFVQVPVYSNLYGVQLFPRLTVSAGGSYSF
ncbi:MAG: transporter [Proteobacteria bacterium]|nr:transporter [Pseudomonadota bacterium]